MSGLSSQTVFPWRAVVRTVFQVAVALAALLPLVFAQAGVSAAETSGWRADGYRVVGVACVVGGVGWSWRRGGDVGD